MQLDGIAAGARRLGHGLGGELIEAVVGSCCPARFGGMGLRLELPEIFVLREGQLFRFAPRPWAPSPPAAQFLDGLHGRLVMTSCTASGAPL